MKGQSPFIDNIADVVFRNNYIKFRRFTGSLSFLDLDVQISILEFKKQAFMAALFFNIKPQRLKLRLGLISNNKMETLAYKKTIDSADIIIASLEKYHKIKNQYPPNLEALVPDYIPVIPKPGVCSHDRFRYRSGDHVPAVSGGYRLFVYLGVTGWTILYYWPSKNYPHAEAKIGSWSVANVRGEVYLPQ